MLNSFYLEIRPLGTFKKFNYLNLKWNFKAPNPKIKSTLTNGDDPQIKKLKTNYFVDEIPVNLIQDDFQIKFMINERNELIYENDWIKIHLKEGNLFHEQTDILVVPATCDLKLFGN